MGHAFDIATGATRVGDNRYVARLDERWHIGGKLHGGYLLGVISQAALAEASHPDLLAVSSNFLRTPTPGLAEILIDRGRTGRRIGYVRVVLSQQDQHIVDAVVTTGTLTTEPPLWSHHSIEEPPGPDDCIAMPDRGPGGFVIGIAAVQDARFDPRMPWLSGHADGIPEMRGWVRFRDGRDADSSSLAFFADSLPPVTFGQGRFGWAPTVHMSVLVRARPAPGWCWVQMKGGSEADGFFDEEVQIWDSTRRLVAHGHQLAASPRTAPS